MTDELRKQLLSAKTEDEAREILRNYSGELTEDELEFVSGGKSFAEFFKDLGEDIAHIGKGIGEGIKGAVLAGCSVYCTGTPDGDEYKERASDSFDKAREEFKRV